MATARSETVHAAAAETGTGGLPGALEVDAAIAGVERLYQVVTGRTPPSSEEPYTPIPVENDPAEVVAERVDRLLDALAGATESMMIAWSPPMTVWEDERGLLVCLDVAGVGRHDLEISLDGELLTVRGKRSVRGGLRLRGSERPLGAFARQIVLPRMPRTAELTAQLRDGVLEILVPQAKAGQASGPRPIAVV